MKSCNTILLRAVKAAAIHALKHDANSTTCFVIHQPKVPAKLNSFKNKNNV